MVAKPVRSKIRFNFGWRGVLTWLLVTIGVVSTLGFLMVHWAERQILNTDNWVKVVGPIPKDDQVAGALSDYSVNKLFNSADLENRISRALPDKASFLAPTLTDQLHSRLTIRTKQIIQSDQFAGIWTSANRNAHQRLLNSARGQSVETVGKKAKFSLDLSALKEKVSGLLSRSGGANNGDKSAENKPDIGLAVNLKTNLEKVKQYIRTIDFLNGTLGVLALVSFVGALVVNARRRRILIIVSLSLATLTLLQLIGVKFLRPMVLNQIQSSSYKPAVGVVYDTLTSSFNKSATVLFCISLVIFLVTILTQSKYIQKSKWFSGQLKHYYKTAFYNGWRQLRVNVRQYMWQIMLGTIIFGLVIMAFLIGSFNWASLIRSILLIVLAIEFIALVAIKPKDKPM